MKRYSPMRRILKLLLLLAIIAGILWLGYALYGRPQNDDNQNQAQAAFYEGEERAVHVLENEHLKFEMDGDSTLFTLTNKKDGHVWHAVPPDADKDPLALAGMKNLLQSTLAITYSTTNGVRTLYDNYEYSIKNKIYTIEADENMIRVNYTLGRIAREYIIPTVIMAEKMDGFLGQLTKAQSRKITDSYRKHDPAKIKENQKEELYAQFPQLEDGMIYVIRDNVKDFLKQEFEELLGSVGYTYEDFQQDKPESERSVGSQTAVFNISVEYSLENNDLIVKVPLDSIRYSADFPPIRVNILPNFGAGGIKDTGYMLMPEGGGALIHFNNGKTAQNGYFANIYGWDYATYRSAIVHETGARFPMFGVMNSGSSFLCLLEDQAAVASVAAEVSGRGNSYNTASASYTLLHSDAFNVTERTIETIYMYETALPKGDISQRYRFIAEDDYVKLAQEYRQYLLSRYPGMNKPTNGKLPLAVEIIGAIDKIQQKGGLPVSAPLKLTSYQEAAEIVSDLTKDLQNTQAHVRLSGWMNGGVRQKMLSRVKLLPQLGSKADYQQMMSAMQKGGAKVYLNGITSYALDSGLTDGFLPLRDAARMTTREVVQLYQYSPIWYGILDFEEGYYLLKPQTNVAMMDKLRDSALNDHADGLAFEDVGNLLSADYNPKNLVTREEAMQLQAAALQNAKEKGLNLMVRGGNLYALEHANLVSDTTLSGVPYFVLDELVPFFDIATHGLTQKTGKPLNLTGDWEEELLQSAQRGAGLSFLFMKSAPLALHDTNYSNYYGASYDLWAKRAKDILTKYEQTMDGLFDQAIVDFKRLDNGVTLTTYEDGSTIAVNYSTSEQEVQGQAVPQRDYIRLDKGVTK